MTDAPERIWTPGEADLSILAIKNDDPEVIETEYVRADIHADALDLLAKKDKAHEKEIAVWSENYAALERLLAKKDEELARSKRLRDQYRKALDDERSHSNPARAALTPVPHAGNGEGEPT